MKVKNILSDLEGIARGTVPMSPDVATGLLRNERVLASEDDLSPEDKEMLERIQERIYAANLWRGINRVEKLIEKSYKERGL
jgi:hypothetical protein